MNISQLNSKTIYLSKDGIIFLIQYFYTWNGIKKEPESVILKTNSISAFFLTSVIRDSIEEIENGFYIERKWQIIPGGELSFSFCLDIVLPDTISFLLPCLLSGNSLPAGTFAFLGERLSHPSSIFLFPEEKGIYISSDLPMTKNDFSSLQISRARTDKYQSIRLEISLPPFEKLPDHISNKPGFIPGEKVNSFKSAGNILQNMGINILIANNKDIYPLAVNYMHHKLKRTSPKQDHLDKSELINTVKHQIDTCINELLISNKGIFGVMDHKKSDSLSLVSTIGLSLLIQKLYKSKTEIHELSLKFADFCLKAQHSSGIFFDKFYVNDGLWIDKSIFKNLKEQKYLPVMISLQKSAEIAYALLLLSRELKEKEYFYNTYFTAAGRFLDYFFLPDNSLNIPGTFVDLVNLTPGESNLHCLNLVFPLFIMYKLTGTEKYKEAILSLKEHFFPASLSNFELPSAQEGHNPDFRTALLLLKAANVFTEIGVEIKDRVLLINYILPWIYYNKSSQVTDLNLTGGILESFDNCRIISTGYELAYNLLIFRKNSTQPHINETIENIVKNILHFSAHKPAGTPYINHTLWAQTGKISGEEPFTFSTNTFVRESLYLIYLADEFPDFIS